MGSRDRFYLRCSMLGLWITPLCAAAILGIVCLIDLFLEVPVLIYWTIAVILVFAWTGEIINIVAIRRRQRGRGA